MGASEEWNPLDLGKLDPDAEGVTGCLAWGIEPLKVLAKIIYDLDQAASEAFEEGNKNRRVYLCRFMIERLDQVESFMGKLEEKLSTDERQEKEISSRRDLEAVICKSGNVTIALSTKHPASIYGIPVLTVNGKPCKPFAALPYMIQARSIVRMFYNNLYPPYGSWGDRTHEAVEMAEVYLRTAEMFQHPDPDEHKDSNENDSLPVHEKESMTFPRRREYPERDFVQAGPI